MISTNLLVNDLINFTDYNRIYENYKKDVMDRDEQVWDPRPKKVIFNKPATIVLWKDGEKTVVKCDENDVYDPAKGLALCYMKRALQNKSGPFNKVLHESGAYEYKTDEKKEKVKSEEEIKTSLKEINKEQERLNKALENAARNISGLFKPNLDKILHESGAYEYETNKKKEV